MNGEECTLISYPSVSQRHAYLLASYNTSCTVNLFILPTLVVPHVTPLTPPHRRSLHTTHYLSHSVHSLHYPFFSSYLSEVGRYLPFYIALGPIIALLSLLCTYTLRRGWCLNSDGRMICKSRTSVSHFNCVQCVSSTASHFTFIFCWLFSACSRRSSIAPTTDLFTSSFCLLYSVL